MDKSDALYESAAVMCDPSAASRPRQWKSRAKRLLEASTALAQKQPKAYALLAYIHFQEGDVASAEVSIRKALRSDTDNRVYLRFLLSILLAQGKDALASRWLGRLANLEGVALPEIKAELHNANMPTDTSTLVLNVFPNGLGWFESSLSDEIEMILSKRQINPLADSEFEEQANQFRPKKIDARKVPRNLRRMIPLAQQWGIGDDVARGSLIHQASESEKQGLRRALPVKVRRRINDWLDSYDNETVMTDEAACFMFLLLAYEELTSEPPA